MASLATTAPAGAATVLRVTVRPRVLVCGWSGAGNVGDELLTEVLSTRLRSAGLDPVIRSVSPNATAAAHGGVAVAQRGFASVRAAFTVDAVVLGPGGIVQDHSSVWSLQAPCAGGDRSAPSPARRRPRPRADPLRRSLSRWLVRRALVGAPIVVRDELSAAVMRDAGLHPEIDLDLVWELDHPESGAGEVSRSHSVPSPARVCGVRVAAVSFLTTRCRWSLRSSGSETLWVVRSVLSPSAVLETFVSLGRSLQRFPTLNLSTPAELWARCATQPLSSPRGTTLRSWRSPPGCRCLLTSARRSLRRWQRPTTWSRIIGFDSWDEVGALLPSPAGPARPSSSGATVLRSNTSSAPAVRRGLRVRLRWAQPRWPPHARTHPVPIPSPRTLLRLYASASGTWVPVLYVVDSVSLFVMMQLIMVARFGTRVADVSVLALPRRVSACDHLSVYPSAAVRVRAATGEPAVVASRPPHRCCDPVQRRHCPRYGRPRAPRQPAGCSSLRRRHSSPSTVGTPDGSAAVGSAHRVLLVGPPEEVQSARHHMSESGSEASVVGATSTTSDLLAAVELADATDVLLLGGDRLEEISRPARSTRAAADRRVPPGAACRHAPWPSAQSPNRRNPICRARASTPAALSAPAQAAP